MNPQPTANTSLFRTAQAGQQGMHWQFGECARRDAACRVSTNTAQWQGRDVACDISTENQLIINNLQSIINTAAQHHSDACVAATFGESFVSQRLQGAPARYTFSACRGMRRLDPKDTETGYSYFGARYYESGLSIWLSVDPLSDNTPFASAYAYCINNPIRLIDPNGRDWVENKYGYIYWDDNVTSQYTAKAGETHLGKNLLVGTHNRDAAGNEKINSARFDLYLESNKKGVTATIMGNTVPSDIDAYGILAEGLYDAEFASRASYVKRNKEDLAILINGGKDVPTLKGNPNRADSDFLNGVFFHMGNNYQTSLFDSEKNPYSKGCQTSGCYPGSKAAHDEFMKAVGTNFSGKYYLRSIPTPIPSAPPFISGIQGVPSPFKQ